MPCFVASAATKESKKTKKKPKRCRDEDVAAAVIHHKPDVKKRKKKKEKHHTSSDSDKAENSKKKESSSESENLEKSKKKESFSDSEKLEKSKKSKKKENSSEAAKLGKSKKKESSSESEKPRKSKKKEKPSKSQNLDKSKKTKSNKLEKSKKTKRKEVSELQADETESKKSKKLSKKKKSSEDQPVQTVGVGTVCSSFTKVEAKAYRKKHMMTVSEDNDLFMPLKKFSETGLDDRLLKCCSGFSSPTPIQSQCWPVVLAGRDCVAIAETGSGKTLGFGLPLLSRVLSLKNSSKKAKNRPLGLIIAPTRELALQSHEVISSASSTCGIRCISIFGGGDRRQQLSDIRQGVDIITATPGRLLSLINEGVVNLSLVRFLVLDEADRMLDLGFVPDVRSIVSSIDSKDLQTMMFSATWPEEVEKIGAEFLNRPVRISIGKDELCASATITQTVEVIEPFNRDNRLHDLLREHHDGKNRIIVFVLYKKEAVRVEHMLKRRKWNCTAIHGDKSQDERFAALEAFRNGSIPILVATDVAARGLDIPNVEVVLNYSFPLTIEDYVHRIGRTGRAGRSGRSHTLFTKLDKSLAGALVNVLNEAGATVPDEMLKFGLVVKRKQHSMYGDHFRRDDRPIKATQHVKF